jgi:uncharacterized protein YutE (UPF0331/DUF86 family)
VAPDVLLRKLAYLRQLLADLAPYQGASIGTVEAEHYKLERLLELLVMAASDIVHHLLGEQGIMVTSYRDAFRRAGEEGMLPQELAQDLQKAAGMRNILVHLYEAIDYSILHESIEPALRDFTQFITIMESRIDEK